MTKFSEKEFSKLVFMQKEVVRLGGIVPDHEEEFVLSWLKQHYS